MNWTTKLIPILAALAALTAAAREIRTATWGNAPDGDWEPYRTTVWNRDILPSEVTSTNTPGSDAFGPDTRRLVQPAYYAFLDGYDTRAYCSTFTAFPGNADVGGYPVASRRLLYFSTTNSAGNAATNIYSFLNRTANLRDGAIRPYEKRDRFAAWGSAYLDRVLEDVYAHQYPAPAYADFGWTTNVADKIWWRNDEEAEQNLYIRFCPSYFQLTGDSLFPMRHGDSRAAAYNPFQTMLNRNGFGFECYHSDKTAYNNFIETDIKEFGCYFGTVVSNAFDTGFLRAVTNIVPAVTNIFPAVTNIVPAVTNVCTFETICDITNQSHRLLYPTLAAADRCLSLYSRSYYPEARQCFLTNAIYGRGVDEYEVTGDLYGDFIFDYASGTVQAENLTGQFHYPSAVTNYIAKTNQSYRVPAPAQAFARISAATMDAGVWVVPDSSVSTNIVCQMWQIFDAIYAAYDQLPVTNGMRRAVVAFTLANRTASCQILHPDTLQTLSYSSWSDSFDGQAVAHHFDTKGYCNFSYDYLDSLDDVHYYRSDLPLANAPAFYYATNICRYCFSSFVYADDIEPFATETLRGRVYSSWLTADDYGFRCHRYPMTGANATNDPVKAELDVLIEKCSAHVGSIFWQNARTYMGTSAAKADEVFQGGVTWSCDIYSEAFQYSIEIKNNLGAFTYYMGGVPITELEAAAAYPSISGRLTGTAPVASTLPGAKNAETYLGVLTEVDWDFPQVSEHAPYGDDDE